MANKNSNVSSGQRHPLSKWGNDDVDLISNINWLGREGSNLRMAESKSAALPLGYAPTGTGEPRRSDFVRGGRTIAARPCPINVRKPHIIYVARVDPPCPGTKLASHDLPRAGRRYRIHP